MLPRVFAVSLRRDYFDEALCIFTMPLMFAAITLKRFDAAAAILFSPLTPALPRAIAATCQRHFCKMPRKPPLLLCCRCFFAMLARFFAASPPPRGAADAAVPIFCRFAGPPFAWRFDAADSAASRAAQVFQASFFFAVFLRASSHFAEFALEVCSSLCQLRLPCLLLRCRRYFSPTSSLMFF